jgi:hypothetical protein
MADTGVDAIVRSASSAERTNLNTTPGISVNAISSMAAHSSASSTISTSGHPELMG